jgi:hypothetical protein
MAMATTRVATVRGLDTDSATPMARRAPPETVDNVDISVFLLAFRLVSG